MKSATQIHLREANFLRERLTALFGTGSLKHLLFVPGLLYGIRLLLTDLGIRKIALTSEEYFLSSDFGRSEVTVLELGDMASQVCRHEPEAVIASVVTWKGRHTQIEYDFAKIREEMGSRCPILIADYSHAGAAGWPFINDLGADLVCGDPCKWLIPSAKPANLGFLAVCADRYLDQIQQIFSPYYLALSAPTRPLHDRWVIPSEIMKLSAWHHKTKINRSTLTELFLDNLQFARALATRWHLDDVPETCILWLQDKPNDSLFDALCKQHLVLEMSGGFRVIARADIARKLELLRHTVPDEINHTLETCVPVAQVA